MAIMNGPTSQIPVIDLSGSLPEAQVAKELVDAAATNGFVYIKNQGKDIPVEVIDDIFDLVSLAASYARLLLIVLSVPSVFLFIGGREAEIQDSREC